MVEAGQVAEFGDDGERDDPLHAAQYLQRLHDRIAVPVRGKLLQLRFNAVQPRDLLIDRVHAFLKHDLLSRGRTDHLRQVALVRGVPVGATDVVQSEPQEERLQSQLRVLERLVAWATAMESLCTSNPTNSGVE
jgi:hypothetical protein